jgi:hypothetical protein
MSHPLTCATVGGVAAHSRRSRWPRPSSGEAEDLPEADLNVGRGEEIARGPDSESGEVEIAPEGRSVLPSY